MVDYFIYLLKDFQDLPDSLKVVRNYFNVDEDAPKLLVNMLLDTELYTYIVNLIDYKQEKYIDVNSKLDIIQLDLQLQNSRYIITNSELKTYNQGHFSPIWRVAAFITFFILEADNYYHANITNAS